MSTGQVINQWITILGGSRATIAARVNVKMLGDETTNNLLHGSDTMVLNLTLGDRVVCAFGELKGQKGILVSNRAGGRALVRVAKGAYIEVPRICIQKDNS